MAFEMTPVATIIVALANPATALASATIATSACVACPSNICQG